MKKIVRTSSAVGTAAALGLALTGCSKQPQASTTDSQGTQAPTVQPSGEAEQPDAGAESTAAPDCTGKDQFTEACGYASPTRYAVLDPTAIRNG